MCMIPSCSMAILSLTHTYTRRARCALDPTLSHQSENVHGSQLFYGDLSLTHTNTRRARCAPGPTLSRQNENVHGSQLFYGVLILIHTNTRIARCAPNKHYEMQFERGIPCSSLLIKLYDRHSQLGKATFEWHSW